MRYTDEHLRRVFEGSDYLLFDGAMGTMLQAAGLRAGEVPELLSLTRPELVEQVHRAYVEVGSEVVSANTFGANARKLEGAATVDAVFEAALACARRSGARYVAADIGPTGTLLKPLGTLDFDEAYELYAEQAHAVMEHGADLVIIETMSDLLETKAAVLAFKEHCDLPIIASMTFNEDGVTFLGTSPEIAAMTMGALGVSAVGINCSQGPDALAPLVARMRAVTNVPLIVQANAGLPRVEGARTVFDVGPDEYVDAAQALLEAGATILGGCCGTTPQHIAGLRALLDAAPSPAPCSGRDLPFAVCSGQRALILEPGSPHVAVIGERINPTGKKLLKEALRAENYDYAVSEALDQLELGADMLDVNVGLPEIDEPAVLTAVMERVQAVCELPLQIDSTDVGAIERAVRRYAGKPLVNSVNGKRESLEAVLPVAARYGCAVVGLTLDEDGIPASTAGRFEIARRIVEAAEAHGIPRSDVVIDCLAMAASTNQEQVPQILEAIRRVKRELGVRTVLGVSNISFGLPQRELVNAVFLASAFGAGLDLAIINPKSRRMRDVVAAQRVLCGQDVSAEAFIDAYANASSPYEEAPMHRAQTADASLSAADDRDPASLVRHLIVSGRKAQMPDATRALLQTLEPLGVINSCFVPALDEVGARFECGSMFLPQLMASAEAVKAGFDVVKELAPAAAGASEDTVVLATVKGDIHDIGKNIVKMLLENYGYHIVDLGRDVSPGDVLEAVRRHGACLVGLSALMTTTVRAMEETIALLRAEEPQVKVLVGGAVLTPEYAQMVGADFYAKDAAEGARIVGAFFKRD